MLKKELEKELKKMSAYTKELEEANKKLEKENEFLYKEKAVLEKSEKEIEQKYEAELNKNQKIKDEIQLMCKTHLHVMYPMQVKYNEQNGQAQQITNEDEHFRFINSISEYFYIEESLSMRDRLGY